MYKLDIIKDLEKTKRCVEKKLAKSPRVYRLEELNQVKEMHRLLDFRKYVLKKLKNDNIQTFNLDQFKFTKNEILKQTTYDKLNINIDHDYCFEYNFNDDEKLCLLVTPDQNLLKSKLITSNRCYNYDSKFIDFDENVVNLSVDLSNQISIISIGLDDDQKSSINTMLSSDKTWTIAPTIVTNNIINNQIKCIHLSKSNKYDKTQFKNVEEYETLTMYAANLYVRLVKMSLKLITCKNVKVQEFIQYKQKPIIKKGKMKIINDPVYKYNAMKLNNVDEVAGFNSFNICKGHFKTFTAEKPLLGKLTGTYWWQPHLRKKENEECIN